MGTQKFKQIVGLTAKQKRELMKMYKISQPTLSRALSGIGDSPKIRLVRSMAIQKYGALEFTPQPKKAKILK